MTIFAWTAMDRLAYPPYFNIRREGDEIVVTIRTEPTTRHNPETHIISTTSGDTHSIRIPAEEWPDALPA